MHADAPAVVPVVHAAYAGLDELAPHEADQWRELLAHALHSNPLARQAVEMIMTIPNFREESTWYREGPQEGRQEGHLEGHSEGRREAAVDTTRATVVRILELRGLVVSDEHRARVARCDDLTALQRWLDQAVVAPSADEALR